MNCPHCNKPLNVAAMLGAMKSKAKSKASRENGKLGGRPVKKKKEGS
jgi:hypothetical protein